MTEANRLTTLPLRGQNIVYDNVLYHRCLGVVRILTMSDQRLLGSPAHERFRPWLIVAKGESPLVDP